MPRLHLQASFFALLCLAGCKKNDPEQPSLTYTTVNTLAGNGTDGLVNGSGAAAEFSYPEGAVVDTQGNIYVADAGNNCVRKITPTGVVSTWAGDGKPGLVNGPAATARFYGVLDVAIDKQNNLYIADGSNYCIRKITAAGMVSTLAGTGKMGFTNGPAATAQFGSPNGITTDAQGNVYVSDFDNYCIRKITPGGTVSTLAGTGQAGYADGAGTSAQFEGPEGLVTDAQGTVYVADFSGSRIRKITAAGVVSTVAGTGQPGYQDGAAGTAQFYAPTGVVLDSQGYLYVSDFRHRIRKISTDGSVSTLTGTGQSGTADGPVKTAEFSSPSGIAVDGSGNLFVTEYGHRIRKIILQ